jgi:NAD(P)-dependent dehydrogenase (short-subunit alcohol dehydrogenase family)
LDIRVNGSSMPDPSQPLAGRAALITGANRGLGLEIARGFVAAGASVMLCARDALQLEAVGRELADIAAPPQLVRWQAADVTDQFQIEALVGQSVDEFGGLHILVNNAGVYGPFGAIEEVDWDEWVRAVEINLYGSVIPVRAVLPHLKRQGYGKIIQLSGGGATNPLPRISAYAASKAAIVRFAETVALECKGLGIDVNSIAPGALNTRLLDDVLAAGPKKVGERFYAAAVKQKESGGVPMMHGTELTVFLASPTSDGITGRLISAVWDKWPDWPDHLDALRDSDVYTLRRITGRDRGLTWGDR